MLARSLIPNVSIISFGTPKLAAKVSESRPLAVSLNSSSAELNSGKGNILIDDFIAKLQTNFHWRVL